MSKRMTTLDISQRILALEPGAKGNSDVSVAHRAGFRSARSAAAKLATEQNLRMRELMSFARWCLSDDFDSRDIGARASYALAIATGETP